MIKPGDPATGEFDTERKKTLMGTQRRSRASDEGAVEGKDGEWGRAYSGAEDSRDLRSGMAMARIELHPADADRAKVMEQFKEDQDFVDAHYDEWSAAYPDRWVVVYQGRLVGAVQSIAEMTRLAADEESIPPMRMVSRYLSSEPVKLILWQGCAV